MTNSLGNTELLILEAARKVFIHKGYAGARMQEIADEAGINKALLHYYFRGKDQLFDAVFTQAIASFLPMIQQVLIAELPLKEKISLFVNTYVDTLILNPHIPAFVIHELNTDPGRFIEKLKNNGINPDIILGQIKKEAADGNIREINGEHFLINLLGMCLFPFMARTVVQGLLRMDNEQYNIFLEERKKEIVQFIMCSIDKT
ncbi:MAG: helix-turn-helix transcriptional regulator [Bacteroidetes bacterium]|nr:helix-turn-helix transcriptional regulator [Bacteroidota bacterium]